MHRKLIPLALRVSTDFIAAMGVATVIGYSLDGYLQTRPWGMVIFTVLGIMAGGLNVYRGLTTLQHKDRDDG
jgi:ATP synthase protein I